MSPPKLLYISVLPERVKTRSHKDALIPEVAPVFMGSSSAHAFFDSSAPGYRVQFIWTPATGGCPSTSSQGWQALDGLQAPDWPPGEVGQGGGAPRGSQPRTLFTDQVLLLAVEVGTCARNIVKVFPEEINIQLVLLAYYKLSGLTGGLANSGQNSHQSVILTIRQVLGWVIVLAK